MSGYWAILGGHNDSNFVLEDLGTACVVLKTKELERYGGQLQAA
jgi:hypothetical protein